MRIYAEGLVFSALAVFALWGAYKIPAAYPGETWAGIVPFSAALLLGTLSVIMLVGAAGQPVDPADIPENPATGKIIGLFLIALVYQYSFRLFGYVLPTALVAPVVLALFGMRHSIGLLASVVLCPLVFYVIFFKLLGVFPPHGEIFDLLDWIGG